VYAVAGTSLPCSAMISFPPTAALSPGERVNHSLRGEQTNRRGFPLCDARCFLSLGERVRMRGIDANWIRSASHNVRNCPMERVLRSAVSLVLAAIAAGAIATAVASPSPAFQVPPDFVIEQVAGKEQVVFPMFGAFDDRGRLFLSESSGLDLYAEITAGTRACRVKLLEDKDGDGRFETSRVFADQLVFPMGLVWRKG